jgi:UDP-N-acetylmuramate dehydrogenase
VEQRLRSVAGDAAVRVAEPLAPLTTFKVGGPADYLVDVRDLEALRAVLAIGRDAALPVTILGGGSNLLVADAGVRGIVLRLRFLDIALTPEGHVRAGAGVTINGLVRWTLTHGRAGLEAWAGTPGTVGGAVYGNAHFRGRLISELSVSVRLLASAGEVAEVPATEMQFGYDASRLQRSGEILLDATFHSMPGDPAVLRETARASLAFRKRTQPLASPSAGCIFQNPDPARERVPDGIPPSAGALVDRAGLKDASVGGARVSATHANFIVSDGGATAADIRALIDRCRQQVRDRFGVDLREEIVSIGFDR